MKGNIRRKEQTDSSTNKPTNRNDEYKAPKDKTTMERTTTEETSTIPRGLDIVNPHKTPTLGKAETVGTREGIDISNSDDTHDLPANPTSDA